MVLVFLLAAAAFVVLTLVWLVRSLRHRPPELPGAPIRLVGQLLPPEPDDDAALARVRHEGGDEAVQISEEVAPGWRAAFQPGSTVTVFGVVTDVRPDEVLYRAPGLTPQVEAYRVVRGSPPLRRRWLVPWLACGLAAAVSLVFALRPQRLHERTAAAHQCPAGTRQVTIPEMLKGGWRHDCLLPDRTRHGPWIVYGEEGLIRALGRHAWGKPDGRWQRWFPGGRLERRGHYKKGLRHGRWDLFHDNGLPRLSLSFRHGLAHGSIAQFSELGRLICGGQYVRGARAGLFSLWGDRVHALADICRAAESICLPVIGEVLGPEPSLDFLYEDRNKDDEVHDALCPARHLIVARCSYHAGQLMGPTWQLRSSGEVTLGSYQQGQPQGLWTHHLRDGSIKQQIWVEGWPKSEVIWDASGQLTASRFFPRRWVMGALRRP